MKQFRTEKDLLGSRQLSAEALYGIHTLRAVENFPLSHRKVNSALIHAYAMVKQACAKTNFELHYLNREQYAAICSACNEMTAGGLDEYIKVDALQGGAGTSTNMNVNEVLCNRALQIMGHSPGDYGKLHPLEHLNLHQSTNDTYPTALKIAAIRLLRELETALVGLLESFQAKEKAFAHVVKIGRTQLRDAVLTTMGKTMSAYAEAIGRDRWRVYKCEERLRVVNLGGTAIGSGLAAPRRYIFKVVENLKQISGIGLARAENLIEATQNTDVFAEVSGILNACAANLLKISSDLRLMSSGPDTGLGEINLPPRQAGSSIMPDKVNPVITEAVSQAAIIVMNNNNTISQAVVQGNLELNAFLPLIADRLLESLHLLTNACKIFKENCVDGITVNEAACKKQVENSTATLTALLHKIGYEKAQQLSDEIKQRGMSLKQLIIEKGLMSDPEFEALTSAEAVTRLGFREGERPNA